MIETNRIEFKRELTRELDIEKEVVAFLNYREGGIIYIGVDDNGKPVDIKDIDGDMLAIKNRIRDGILPTPMGLFDVTVERIDEKPVIKVFVSSGTEKPYYKKQYGLSPKGCFIRIGTAAEPMTQEQIDAAVDLIREHNSKATIITTPLAQLDGRQILETFEGREDLNAQILAEVLASEEASHHHHHHDGESHKIVDEEGNVVYRAHHDHDDDDHDHEEHEHHHDHDHEEHEHHHDHDHEEHEHHHDHDHEEHEHHHDHDADDIFESWGMETPNKYTAEEVENILKKLDDNKTYGIVLRSKGMLPSANGTWIHFDYVPGQPQVRTGAADVTGKSCVIGSQLNQDALEKLWKRR